MRILFLFIAFWLSFAPVVRFVQNEYIACVKLEGDKEKDDSKKENKSEKEEKSEKEKSDSSEKEGDDDAKTILLPYGFSFQEKTTMLVDVHTGLRLRTTVNILHCSEYTFLHQKPPKC